jgi:hypothetical protein
MSSVVKANLHGLFFKELRDTVNSTAEELIQALKAATPVDTGQARDGWRYEDGKIINDVEYISELNEGTSKQAPAYFIERTLLAHSQVDSNGVIVTPTN